MRRRAEPTTSASPSRMSRPPRRVRPEAASRSRCACATDVRACAAVCVRACAFCVRVDVRACVRACTPMPASVLPSLTPSPLAPAPLALSLHTFSARHRTRTTAGFPAGSLSRRNPERVLPMRAGWLFACALVCLRVCLFSDPAACCGVCVRGDRATACRCAAVGRYGGLDRAARRLSYVRQGTQRCCAHCRPPVAAVECWGRGVVTVGSEEWRVAWVAAGTYRASARQPARRCTGGTRATHCSRGCRARCRTALRVRVCRSTRRARSVLSAGCSRRLETSQNFLTGKRKLRQAAFRGNTRTAPVYPPAWGCRGACSAGSGRCTGRRRRPRLSPSRSSSTPARRPVAWPRLGVRARFARTCMRRHRHGHTRTPSRARTRTPA